MTEPTSPPRPDASPPLASRRIVFSGLGALGVAATLAGCGSSSNRSNGSASGGSSASAGSELVATSDVPVGGGVILTDAKVVVTQPTTGDFKAFTAVCTHQGFTVTSVADDVITCSHHGSEFSGSTGKVERGPASEALASVAITVENGKVLVA